MAAPRQLRLVSRAAPHVSSRGASPERRARTSRPERAPLAKLTRPRLDTAYPRERLFQLLDGAGSSPLVWIAGAPGAGKTTLAATWLAARRRAGIWYQLDSGDADAATFFYYLKRAAASAGVRASAGLPLLSAEYQDDLPGFAHRWFRELFSELPDDAIVTLDNYQEVPAESDLHRVVAVACEEVPRGAQLLVISRSDPPAELARAVALERVARVRPDDLRLTPEEAAGIGAGQGPLAAEQVRELHAACGGWAAGFTLLRERTRRTGLVSRMGERATMQEVFDFFMAQVFRDIPAHRRESLLKTAVLARFTEAMAIELTGSPDAGDLLEWLCRRHLFVEQRYGAEITYQYHPLFRAFLLDQARRRYTTAERASLSHRAAEILERSAAPEDALQLLLDAGDHGSASVVLEKLAPGLVAAGRGATYREWLSKLHEADIDAKPFLSFWCATSLMGVNVGDARAAYERSYMGSVRERDRTGQAMAVAGVLHTFLLALDDDLSPVQGWLATAESLIADDPPFPSSALAARVYATLLGIVCWMAPSHPMLPVCVSRLEKLLVEPLDDDVKVAAATQLAEYYGAAGFVRDAERVITASEPLARRALVSPLARTYWYLRTCRREQATGDAATMRAKLARALEIAAQHHRGPGGWVAQLMLADLALDTGDLDAVTALVEQMPERVPNWTAQAATKKQQVSRMVYLRGKHAALVGDLDGAVRYLEHASSMTSDAVVALSSWTAVCLAAVLLERGDVARARAVADRWRGVYPLGTFPLQAFRHEALDAVIAAASGDVEPLGAISERLRDLERLGVAAPLPMQPVLSRQLAELLVRHGVEVAYVRSWIRRMNLRPSSRAPPEWPWPVRVRTLGEFAVEVGGAPLTFARKAPKKPLELLQAIVAFGGKDIRNETLCGALWPDSEGDTAETALRVTMTRLRKLLDCDAVVQHQGRISLDVRLCWTDAGAFRDLCREIGRGGNGDEMKSKAAELMDVYRGPFLANEREEPWMLGARGDVRREFAIAVATVTKQLDRDGHREEAERLRREADVRDRHLLPSWRSVP